MFNLVCFEAIRYEPHAASALSKMLVKRALMNYRLGHTLFWLLRAELAQFPINSDTVAPLPPLYIRFALMLEALCRGMVIFPHKLTVAGEKYMALSIEPRSPALAKPTSRNDQYLNAA